MIRHFYVIVYRNASFKTNYEERDYINMNNQTAEDIKNPKLIEAIQKMRKHDNEVTRSRVAEALMEAHLLSPIVRQNVIGEQGPSVRIRFEELRNGAGDKYYMAYTDLNEYNKWNDDSKHNHALIMTMQEFGHILIRTPNDMKGFVVNPYGENLIIPKSLLLSLLQQHEAMQAQKGKK